MQRSFGAHLLLIAVLASASCAVTYAQDATSKPYFISRVEQLLLHEAGNAGRFNNRLEAAYHGVTAADSIQKLSSVNVPAVCAIASQSIKDDVALQDTYYASHILSRLSCQNSQAAKRAAAVALETLQHVDSVEAAYQSISILSNLHKSKQLDQAVPAALIERVLSFFKDLVDSSGIFKSSKSNAQRSILATGLVYQALAEARGLEIALSASCESAVDDIRASLPQVLQGGKDGQAVLFLPGEEDQAEAAAQLVIGAAAIYDESFSSITASSLTGAAQLFSGAQHVHSLADAAQVGPALQALTQSALPHPLHASLATPGIGLDHQEALVLTVRDAWGQPVPAGAVALQVSPRDAAQQQPTSHKLQHGAATGEFLYDVAASSLKPGSYLLRAVIEDAAGSSAGQSDLSLTISGELQNASLTLAFTEGESEDASNETLHYPMTLSTTTATLDPSQVLKASLVVQGLNPHQRMLRLASKLTGAAAYFSLKPSRVKDETYTITITSNSIDKQIGSQAGEFDMELLIGDKTIGTPVRWHLASVAVSYQANEDGPQSALPSALADVQKQFQPKPEIVHIQRAPGKSPAKAISLLFTVFSLLPLLCLVYTLQLAGANLKGFPTSGPSFIAAVAFHGGIASILTLYTMFWLRLNLMQTLPPLLVLGLFTTVAGYNALSRQAEARLKQQ